jgi:cell division protein FtsZ
MQAERGMQELLDSVDTLIVIPNEKLLAVAKDAGFFESFRIADDVLRQGVQGISDIITIPGVINRDFADVKTTMAGMGYAVMGTSTGKGDNRALDAAIAAMASPLLEAGAIDGARGILINITGSSNLKLSEVNEASTIIQNAAHEDCNIIFGAVLDERMGDDVKITVIATGFKQEMPERRARMLAEAMTPSADYEVPIRTRGVAGRGMEAPAPFASEEREARMQARSTEPVQQIPMPQAEVSDEAEDMAEAWDDEFEADAEVEEADGVAEATQEKHAEPELIPVAASVFDDDFFHSGQANGQSGDDLPRVAAGNASAADSDGRDCWGSSRDVVAVGNGAHGEPSEVDELDIPAFLRRGH